MKILRIIGSLDPAKGGPCESIKQTIRATTGHETEVITLDSPKSPWLTEAQFKTHALGPTRLGNYSYTNKLIPWLIEHANEYDALIIHGLWQYHSYATWKALKKLNVPYFIYTHGMLDPWFKKRYPLKHLKKSIYWPWSEYKVLRDAHAVLFTSEQECMRARESFSRYQCRERVVCYGTSKPCGNIEKQKALFLKTYPLLQEKRVFLFLSRIHEKKGCDILIEAFAKVAKKDEALHLVMAGPDQNGLQKKLIQLSERLNIENRITWTNMILNDLKWGAYHSAEAFVLPSHQENFGIAVAEALACGKPVLISNKVNIWHEIETDGAGIVAEDNLKGTTELFEKWLAMDEAAQAAMQKKARLCFESKFEIGKAAQNLIDIIKESINAP